MNLQINNQTIVEKTKRYAYLGLASAVASCTPVPQHTTFTQPNMQDTTYITCGDLGDCYEVDCDMLGSCVSREVTMELYQEALDYLRNNPQPTIDHRPLHKQ